MGCRVTITSFIDEAAINQEDGFLIPIENLEITRIKLIFEMESVGTAFSFSALKFSLFYSVLSGIMITLSIEDFTLNGQVPSSTEDVKAYFREVLSGNEQFSYREIAVSLPYYTAGFEGI